MRSGSAAWQNPRAIPKFLSLREDLGFGETARSRLKFGSARRAAPTHFFDLRGFASFAGLSETAEDCHFYNGFSLWLRAFV